MIPRTLETSRGCVRVMWCAVKGRGIHYILASISLACIQKPRHGDVVSFDRAIHLLANSYIHICLIDGQTLVFGHVAELSSWGHMDYHIIIECSLL